MAVDELPLVLTVEEVARLLRTGRTATYDAVRRGQIPSVRVGTSIRIPRHALAELLQTNGSARSGAAGTGDEAKT